MAIAPTQEGVEEEPEAAVGYADWMVFLVGLACGLMATALCTPCLCTRRNLRCAGGNGGDLAPLLKANAMQQRAGADEAIELTSI